MTGRLFQQKKIGIFVISIILLSMVSATSVHSDTSLFSETSVSELQSHSNARNDSLEVHDDVIMVKNNGIVLKNVLPADDLLRDVIHVNDFVVLSKTHLITNSIYTPLAIMERIFERQKIIKQISNLKIESVFDSAKSLLDSTKQISVLDNSISVNSQLIEYDQFNLNSLSFSDSEFLLFTNNGVLLLLVPLSGYILIRIESPRTKLAEFRKPLCYSFVLLILSSGIITPLSISDNYWNDAFAEEMLSNSNITTNTTTIVPTNTTTIVPTNTTTIVPTNTTTIVPTNTTTIVPTNTTTIEYPNLIPL